MMYREWYFSLSHIWIHPTQTYLEWGNWVRFETEAIWNLLFNEHICKSSFSLWCLILDWRSLARERPSFDPRRIITPGDYPWCVYMCDYTNIITIMSVQIGFVCTKSLVVLSAFLTITSHVLGDVLFHLMTTVHNCIALHTLCIQ